MSPTYSQLAVCRRKESWGRRSLGDIADPDARKSHLVETFAREKAKYGVSTVPSEKVFNT